MCLRQTHRHGSLQDSELEEAHTGPSDPLLLLGQTRVESKAKHCGLYAAEVASSSNEHTQPYQWFLQIPIHACTVVHEEQHAKQSGTLPELPEGTN